MVHDVKKKNYHYFYFFLIFSFYAVYQLRNNFGDESESLIVFLFILLICISTDIGGLYIWKNIQRSQTNEDKSK